MFIFAGTEIVPETGFSSPEISRKSVDFPVPFAPTIP